MTVFWQADDLKVSHVDHKEVTKFMKYLQGIYKELKIPRWKLHDYIGMALNFWTPGDLRVTMVDYIKGVLENFPEVIMGWSTILAAGNLFQVIPEDERKLLDEYQATMTVFWQADDLKVSHVDHKEVTKFMKYLQGIYKELKIPRWKLHDYIGMALNFWTPGDLRVTMVDYIKGVLENFPEVIMGWSTILAAGNLFQVIPEDERKLLDEYQATSFHHTLAQFMFFTSRARKDIKISAAFLCT